MPEETIWESIWQEENIFFFLNNDTLIKDDTLGYLVQRLESSAKAGGAGPKIRFAWEPYPIQFAGYTELSAVSLRNELIGFMRPDEGEYDIAHITPYIHGAAFMLKREAVEIAGKMPEVFFLYYEELDWSERIRECGYELWYEPKAVVYHKESRSTGAESPLKVFYMTRNRLLYAVRNRKKGTAVLSVLYQLIFAVPKQIFMCIWKGKPVLAGAALKGVKDFFKL